jgi:predicted ArsR family transcriptional regulator
MVLWPQMVDLEVIDDPGAAAIAVEPVKSQLLAALASPASAATLATRLGIARQKINYHLRTLEAYGLVQISEERVWGGLR